MPHARSMFAFAFAFVAISALGAGATTATLNTEASFIAENEAAMNKMMDGMTAMPSGDVDRDFTEMMIPHHQGAIDMAKAELRFGHNEHLRRLAQEIIVEQQQEIAAMRLALGDPLPPSVSSPTQTAPQPLVPSASIPHSHAMSGGMMMTPASTPNQQDHR